jgi:phospholipid transport system transporter-binding protein
MTTTPAKVFVEVSSGVYRIEAPLTFATVAALHADGIRIIDAASGELTLDLQAVPKVDSAGLALLIEWLGAARAKSRSLKYSQPPEALLSLARLSDVEKLIA